MLCRLDKNDGYNAMGSNFTNLARLMENNPVRYPVYNNGIHNHFPYHSDVDCYFDISHMQD